MDGGSSAGVRCVLLTSVYPGATTPKIHGEGTPLANSPGGFPARADWSVGTTCTRVVTSRVGLCGWGGVVRGRRSKIYSYRYIRRPSRARRVARPPDNRGRSPSLCTRGHDFNRKAACSPHYSRATLWYAHRLSIPLSFCICSAASCCTSSCAGIAMDNFGRQPGARRYQASDGRERLA